MKIFNLNILPTAFNQLEMRYFAMLDSESLTLLSNSNLRSFEQDLKLLYVSTHCSKHT